MIHRKQRDSIPSQLQAVLWDLDGTLIDSEPYWCEAEFDIARRHGASWSMAHSVQLIGSDLLDAGRYIRKHMRIDLTPTEIVADLLDGVTARIAEFVPWRAGALQLLSAIRAANLPCALVTMSYRRFADPVIAALPEGTFGAIITGDAVVRGKPHPDPYLAAAAELRVDPGSCVAIEDSPTGMRSALAAGCRVVVAPSHRTASASAAHLAVDSLADLTVVDLSALMATPLSASDAASQSRA